jgi:hypothetical protein
MTAHDGIPMTLLGSAGPFDVWILNHPGGNSSVRVLERGAVGSFDRYEVRALAKLLEVASDRISEPKGSR